MNGDAGVKDQISRPRLLLSVVADLASISTSLVLVVVTVVASAALVARRTAVAGNERAAASRSVAPPLPFFPVEGIETTENGTTVAAPAAKVALVEFGDFDCPACGQFAREVLPSLRRQYVDTGRVAYSFRSLPLSTLHPRAAELAMAAICAGEQGKYWEMHERFFAIQKPGHVIDVPQTAAVIGLNTGRFDRCIAPDGRGRAALADDLSEGRRLKISGTPTFLLGFRKAGNAIDLRWRINGSVPFAVFKLTLDAMLTAGTQHVM